MYNKPLPAIEDIQRLSKLESLTFPADRQTVLEQAEKNGFDNITLDFIRHFPASERFESPDSFVLRCEAIELMIEAEKDSTPEQIRSPQD